MKNAPIRIFYFVAEMNGHRWKDMRREQMELIEKSGLLEACEKIHVCLGGPFRKMDWPSPKYHACYFSRLDQYEYPALRMIQQYAQPGEKIMYLHTKGISRTGKYIRPGDLWREYLMWGNVERWREHVAGLDYFDLSGVQLTNLDPRFKQLCGTETVYAGNFWWANSDYVLNLPPAKVVKNRWAAEGWVMQGNPKCHDLHNLTNRQPITTTNTFSRPDFSRAVYDAGHVVKVPPMVESRHDIINSLIESRGYKSYLEIGVWQFQCFKQVECESKECVDPEVKGATYQMTSDQFFEQNEKKYDVIFVDGLHTEKQAAKDIDNALACLNEGGVIILHDCNPETEHEQRGLEKYDKDGIWVGDVWKAYARLRMTRKDLSMHVIDTDFGCGIIERGSQELFPKRKRLDYKFFVQNRKELMNVIEPEDFWKWLNR